MCPFRVQNGAFLHDMGEKSTFFPQSVENSFATYVYNLFLTTLITFFLLGEPEKPKAYKPGPACSKIKNRPGPKSKTKKSKEEFSSESETDVPNDDDDDIPDIVDSDGEKNNKKRKSRRADSPEIKQKPLIRKRYAYCCLGTHWKIGYKSAPKIVPYVQKKFVPYHMN